MEPQRYRILLVEDDPDDVWVMRSLLADSADMATELVHAERLSAAFRLCRERHFDVVLLDLTLPDFSGLETFTQAYEHIPGVPIVILTGLADQAAAIKAVQAGAEDFLVKGRVDDSLLLKSIRYAVERNRRRQAEQALVATRHEFELARTMQQRLFPAAPPWLKNYSFAGATFSAEATGGDYFDYFPLRNGAWAIVVADVSEHGIGPSFLMAETRAYLRALAHHSDSPGKILTQANKFLCEDTKGLQFVTLFFAKLEPDKNLFTYASAGHPAYLIQATGSTQLLDSTSMPLGFEPSLEVPETPPLALQRGDVVLIATDGVWETISPDGQLFGTPRMLEVLRKYRLSVPDAILARLHEAVCDFAKPRAPQDDVTVVVVQANL